MPTTHKVISSALGVASAVVLSGLMAAPAHAADTSTHAAYEQNVVNAINTQRKAHHLPTLSYAGCPDHYSERLAGRLAYSGTLYHQALSPIATSCTATRVTENLVRASGSSSSTTIVNLWMQSSAHRANILDPHVTAVGLGTSCNSSNVCTTVADFIN